MPGTSPPTVRIGRVLHLGWMPGAEALDRVTIVLLQVLVVAAVAAVLVAPAARRRQVWIGCAAGMATIFVTTAAGGVGTIVLTGWLNDRSGQHSSPTIGGLVVLLGATIGFVVAARGAAGVPAAERVEEGVPASGT